MTPSSTAAAESDTVAEAQALIDAGRFGWTLWPSWGRRSGAGSSTFDTLFLYGMAALGGVSRQAGVTGTRPRREAAGRSPRRLPHHAGPTAPELVRVRLELARAFFLKQEDALARRHFEQVLAGRPPPAVAANVVRFLRTLRARRRWQAHFGAAIAPDSNLNAASGERTIFLDFGGQRLPFTRQGDIAPKSGLGVSLWGGSEYQIPLNPVWRLRSGANASVRDYKGGTFDRHSVSAHLGPRRLIDARTEASLLATVERQWTAGAPETDRFGIRLEGEHRLTPRLALFGRASAARRNCRDCDWLDGPVGDVSLGASWAALPVLRFGGNAGWSWSRANLEHWRNSRPAGEPGRDAGAAGGLHGGPARRPAAHRIPGPGLRPQHHRPRAARGRDADPLRLGPQPRLHAGRFQPAPLAHPRGARHQRPGPRLQAQPGGAEFRAAVLSDSRVGAAVLRPRPLQSACPRESGGRPGASNPSPRT